MLLLVAALAATLPWTVRGSYDAATDASLYVESARSLLSGEGYSYLGTPLICRPPGWSVLLAPVIELFGTSFRAWNAFVSLFGIALVAAMFAFYRERLGALCALALCAAVWLNPAFQRLCNQQFSDVPGAALLFFCLLLERRAGTSARSHAILGLVLSAAIYVRSANLLLLPAIALARLLSSPRRVFQPASLASLAIPVLALLPWSIRNAAREDEVPVPTEQVYMHSYSTAMWHSEPTDPSSPRLSPSGLAERIPDRWRDIFPLLGRRMREAESSSTLDWTLGVIAILFIAAECLRSRGACEIYGLLVFALLSIYFGFKPRLVLPLYLIALPAGLGLLRWSLSALTGARASRLTALACTGLCVLDFDPSYLRAQIDTEHSQRAELCAYLESRFPNGENLAAPHGWHYAVYMDRPVYSLQIAAHRQGIAKAVSLIDRYSIAAVFTDESTEESRAFGKIFKRLYTHDRSLAGHEVFVARP